MPGSKATLEGIPAWLYLTSGAGVVLVSFALVGAFVGRETRSFSYRRYLFDIDLPGVKPVARVFFVGLYVAVIALAFFGPNDLQTNHAPTFLVEIYWWVSYSIFAILVGNVWPIINPWKTIFEWLGEPSLGREYPESLGSLPALLVFLVFAWLNMIVLLFGAPLFVGIFALGYGVLMVGGMAVYGKESWLQNVDAFTRVFDFFGRFAPLEFTDDGVELRGYSVGLVDDAVKTSDDAMLVIAMLYALSFDGFKETPTYIKILQSLSPEGLSPILANALVGGMLLLAGFALFVVAYIGVSALMKFAAGSDHELGDIMTRFALTLVPIAGAYHLAHYSLYYFLQHEILIQVFTSPLPGDALKTDPDLLSFLAPTDIWYYMVALIVIGHVIAVWVAHHVSLKYFDSRRAAIRSQVPMLVLMVFYSIVSLWIISQPFSA